MMDAFRAQGGSKSVNVVAGHRTADYQQHLFDQSAERNGLSYSPSGQVMVRCSPSKGKPLR